MNIKELITRIHIGFADKIQSGELDASKKSLQEFSTMTSQELTAIIGDKKQPYKNRRAAAKMLVALSGVEDQLDGYLREE